MSRFFEAVSGPFTMTVEDTTGSAPDLGRVQVQGLRPGWGELRRTFSPGLYPAEMELVAHDPTNEIRDRLTGTFNETDYEISLNGPEGPTGNAFKLELWPKQRTATSPLSERVHPDKTVITVYDGLGRMKDPPSQWGSVQAVALSAVMNTAFNIANQGLNFWARIPVRHSTAGWGGFYDHDDLNNIIFAGRAKQRWSHHWDAMKEIATRYGCAIFQDPYHHDSNDRPRWKVVATTDMGQPLEGWDAEPDTVTSDQPTDTVTVPRSDLSVSQGEELEAAVVFRVSQSLPRSPEGNEASPLVVNGDKMLRDEIFEYENSNTNAPLYGESQRVTVISNDQIELDPDETNDQDAYWRSEPFHAGTKEVFGVFEWDLSLDNGQSGTVEVFIQDLDEDGNVTNTITVSGANATGVDVTREFDTEGPLVRVGVRVEHDADAAPVYHFGQPNVVLYESEALQGSGDPSDLSEVTYVGDDPSLIEKGLADFEDMRLTQLPLASPNVTNDVAPASEYVLRIFTPPSGVDSQTTYTAGETAKAWRFRIADSGTQTLRSQLKEHFLGPNTRVQVEDESGTVIHELVMGGGRELRPLGDYTDLADIDTS